MMSERTCGSDCECRNGDYELGEVVEVQRRGPSGDSTVVSVRVSRREFQAIGMLAEQDGSRVSTLMRQAIQDYISRRTSNLVAADIRETVNRSRPTFTLLRYAR